MRIAVLIIALCLAGIVGLQSCTIHLGGNVTADEGLSQGGAVGVLVALLYVLGAAFVMGLPRVAAGSFALAAVFALATASSGAFEDLNIWGGGAAILAAMSWFGAKERSTGNVASTQPINETVPVDRGGQPLNQQPRENNLVRELERLSGLRANGAITDAEFEGMKAQLLQVAKSAHTN